jgi:hypothetical protein
LVQAQIRFADVTGNDLEVVSGQGAEPLEQLRIAAVENILQPVGGRVGIRAARVSVARPQR